MTSPTSRVRFGIGPLTGQAGQQDDPVAARQEMTVAFDAVLAAEEHGFDGAWVSEHHLSDDGYLTSPLLLLAALATHTHAIALGTDVALAPLYSPMRLADDASFVNAICDGRLLLGLGTGYRAVEFVAFGVNKVERVERLMEAVDVVRRRALPRDAHCVEGKRVVTRTAPSMTILLGGFAQPAVRRAGRLADGWIAPTLRGRAELEERIRWLTEEGAFDRGDFHVVVNIPVFVAAVAAWEVARDGILCVERQYGEWKAVDDAATAERHGHASQTSAHPPPHVVVGTPTECIDRLQPWHDLLSALPKSCIPWINVRLHYPGVGTDATLDAVALFADRVIPGLRKG